MVIKSSKDDKAPAKIMAKPQGVKKCATSLDHVATEVDIPLPKGSVLTTVWGIELSHEDIGHALQFLEFCAAFGKVIYTCIFHLKVQPPNVLFKICSLIGLFLILRLK